jgi:hypothetical protein
MPGSAARPFARMATTGITRMRARRTATMGRSFSWAACLSARGRGITAGTGGVIMAGPDMPTVEVDTATTARVIAIGRGTEIAQVLPIGAVPPAAIEEEATAATVRAHSTAAVDSTATVEAASMEAAGAAVAGAANLI